MALSFWSPRARTNPLQALDTRLGGPARSPLGAPREAGGQMRGPLLPAGAGSTSPPMGQGSPTVILSAGMGNWAETWRKIQPAVAARTRVCAWDRAGFGFSTPSPEPQDVTHTTKDLERSLKACARGQRGPGNGGHSPRRPDPAVRGPEPETGGRDRAGGPGPAGRDRSLSQGPGFGGARTTCSSSAKQTGCAAGADIQRNWGHDIMVEIPETGVSLATWTGCTHLKHRPGPMWAATWYALTFTGPSPTRARPAGRRDPRPRGPGARSEPGSS